MERKKNKARTPLEIIKKIKAQDIRLVKTKLMKLVKNKTLKKDLSKRRHKLNDNSFKYHYAGDEED